MSFEKFGNLPDLFTNIIFGVVIAISFDKEIIKDIFIPITNLGDPYYLVNAVVIFFPIFYVVARWVKYFEEYDLFPATMSIIGILRLIINMILLGFIYQLFLISSPKSGVPYDYTIIWLLPIINGITVIIQILIYYEHKKPIEKIAPAVFVQTEMEQIAIDFFKADIIKNVFILFLSLLISFIYITLSKELGITYLLLVDNKNYYDIYFIVAYYAIITYYFIIDPFRIRKEVRPTDIGE